MASATTAVLISKAATVRAAQQRSHFLRQLLPARLGDAQLRSLVPRQTITQELPLPRPRHRALGLIHLELKPLFQKSGQTVQQPHARPLAADVDIAVVRVAAERVASSFQFPVQSSEQDVGQ